MRRALLTLAAFVAVAGAAVALGVVGGDGPPREPDRLRTGGQDFSARFARFNPAREPNGDPRKVVWPDYVLDAGPEVKRLYEFQITHGELMRYMPCFCGCGGDGHRSNRDCYVKAVRPDGSVILDSMAPT